MLGASLDMGWGVTYQETYSHQLEEWLNWHGRRRGIDSSRRFEVLNFAVAAYSPLQRLETLRRKALAFHPDLVIYSATMLDLRLMEIHLCDALRTQADLTYDFVKATLDQAGVSRDQFAGRRARESWSSRTRSRPRCGRITGSSTTRRSAHWPARAGPRECRCLIVIIPRVGKADAPLARAESVARLKAIAGHHALPVYDLSDTFDRYDPASLEIAAWDDHPNALGHRRLFLALARSLVKDEARYRLLFPAGANAQPGHRQARSSRPDGASRDPAGAEVRMEPE